MTDRASAPLPVFTYLTYLRVALVPVVMVLALLGPTHPRAFVGAAGVFAAAAATDFVDGYLARRWGATTSLGSFLDTTADKLLVAGALIALVSVERTSPWVAFAILGREFLILGLRGVVADAGGLLMPSPWGKLKANAQFLAIFLAFLRYPRPLGPLLLDEWVMLAAVTFTLVSAGEYLVRFASVLRARPGR